MSADFVTAGHTLRAPSSCRVKSGARVGRTEMERVIEFFRAGGWPMLVILALGLLTLAAAVQLWWRPFARHEAALRALSWATIFSVLSGVASDLATVFHHVSTRDEWAHSPDLHLLVMTGLAESLMPAVLGFSLLSVAWLVAAAGLRRSAPER